MDILLNDTEFKKNVGDFILTFSSIEFSLGVILSKLNSGKVSENINHNLIGLELSNKRKEIRLKLKDNKSLLVKWDKLNTKLEICNQFRKLIVHGIIMNHLVNTSIQSVVKSKKGFRLKDITNKDVLKHLYILHDLNTGKQGLGVLEGEINEWIKSNNRDV